MSLHIHRFVDLIKATESRGQKTISMPLRDAKDLHADITKLLLTLEDYRQQAQSQQVNETLEVIVEGGSFKNT